MRWCLHAGVAHPESLTACHAVFPKDNDKEEHELFDLVSAGKIVNEPKQTFALADAAEAHRALEARKTVGATVLVP